MVRHPVLEFRFSIPVLLSHWAGVLMLTLTAQAGLAQVAKHKTPPQPTIVFVCEHGAAKSVIAAAWFNKLAAEQHLPFRAIARGLTPQDDLSESAVAGLRRDGIAFPSDKPLPLTESDARNAARVVALGPLSTTPALGNADSFDVPAPKDGYNQLRDAIVSHVNAVLKDLREHWRAR